jgi:hypothetical protein
MCIHSHVDTLEPLNFLSLSSPNPTLNPTPSPESYTPACIHLLTLLPLSHPYSSSGTRLSLRSHMPRIPMNDEMAVKVVEGQENVGAQVSDNRLGESTVFILSYQFQKVTTLHERSDQCEFTRCLIGGHQIAYVRCTVQSDHYPPLQLQVVERLGVCSCVVCDVCVCE